MHLSLIVSFKTSTEVVKKKKTPRLITTLWSLHKATSRQTPVPAVQELHTQIVTQQSRNRHG